MSRILVAGGTGALGSAVVEALKKTDHRIRIMSRRPAPADLDPSIEWAQADVTREDGLRSALAGVERVVNCVGYAPDIYETDVVGVQRLAETARVAGVRHFFHISIVGIDQIDFDYYRYKLSAEARVIQSGVPYSIQRVTQFHSLLERLMSQMQRRDGSYVLPTDRAARFQLIDTRDVAAYILPLVEAAPAEYLPDVGGPEILNVEQIARVFLRAQGEPDPTLLDPASGFFSPAAVEAFRAGLNTAPDNPYGQITWADYVRERYGGGS